MFQHSFYKTIFLLLPLFFLFSCEEKIPAVPKDLSKEITLPQVLSLSATGSSFALRENVDIVISEDTKELRHLGEYLATLLRPATGFPLPVKTLQEKPYKRNITLALIQEEILEMEGYKLDISEDKINLSANQPAGLFRGMQTIRQLLPAAIERDSLQVMDWNIASGQIIDRPFYAHRGAMLDVSRHFFGVSDVKKFIDYLATYKMNILHLHLADDQGWRLEIKSWPKLTTIGGSTEVGGGKGGFYTQEDYKDIVQYAADLYITVIPEIDMPGHTNAALASYPELNCNGKAPKLYTGMRVGFSSFCTKKEITYDFIEDVFTELVALTPGPYIHIGGDESHSTKKKDYIEFVDKVQEIVDKHGKKMIGWDDITAAHLNPNTVAQHWSNPDNALKAVSQNVKLILSPAKKAYLDMKYDTTTKLGLNWAGYIEVDTAYSWYPETYIEGVQKENILGVEAPLWTETVTNIDELEYLVFPRLLGYAEIGWTVDTLRNWEDYRFRLGAQKERFDILGIDYYESDRVDWK